MPLWVGALVFTVFACGGFLATRCAEWLTSTIAAYKELPVRWEPPLGVALGLAGVTGIVGTSYVARNAPVPGIALLAVVCFGLAFACYADLRVGRAPWIVMVPMLALFAGVDIAQGAWLSMLAASLVTAPFAAAAFLSKNRNLGWSDVQVAALGALVLDVSLGLVVLAAACFATVGIAAVRRKLKEPVAFAPYLTGGIALALLVPNSLQ